MKPKFKIAMFLLGFFIVLPTGISFSGETLQQMGDVKGRSYHVDLYDGDSCDSCHDSAKPTTFPEDYSCLSCHDGHELIEATARPEEDKWQNPHNNMHHGKDVPCMECHGEHKESKMLCAGCHSFNYPNFKN